MPNITPEKQWQALLSDFSRAVRVRDWFGAEYVLDSLLYLADEAVDFVDEKYQRDVDECRDQLDQARRDAAWEAEENY